jgi:protein gp37
MSDLFHDEVPDEHIAKVFAVMCHASHHTFQLLTKRHARMRSLLSSDRFRELVFTSTELDPRSPDGTTDILTDYWPLPNVWLGVSTENQQWADIRIPALLDTPAAVRFISAEPLLGPIDLSRWVCNCGSATDDDADHYGCTACTCARYVVDHSDPEPHHPENVDIEDDPNCLAHHPKLGWVIVGGESGPGARPMHPDWARSLRDQCTAAGVPFLFKQRGEWTWSESDQFRVPTKPYTNRVAVMHGNGMTAMTKENPFNPFERGHPHWATRIERVGKKRAGRELDGRTWDEFPEVSGV